MTSVEQVAAAILYEGYILWPYRRSARKNQQRWTFGGVYPRTFSEAGGGSDPWQMQTQCLLEADDPAATVDVRVRFLQVVERRVGRRQPDGTLAYVDELRLGTERYLTWDEAREREVCLLQLPLAGTCATRIGIAAGEEVEPLGEHGALVRSWQELRGALEVRVEELRPCLYRLTARISNTLPWSGGSRDAALRHSFVSTHTILHAHHAGFVSMTDPPPPLASLAEQCDNQKTWPVLAGEEGSRDTLLSSPIILYDYPRIAPESHGDLFDAGEIDQLLALNILTLTDDEKAEMRDTDPRTRQILERTEAFTAEDLMGLHGAIRELRVLREEGPVNPLFNELEQPAPTSVSVAGGELRVGSRVRLRPHAGRDIMDAALDGKTAIVEAIEQDYEARVHLAVTVEDDPGRDLGQARLIGHRFFFAPEEVEPA